MTLVCNCAMTSSRTYDAKLSPRQISSKNIIYVNFRFVLEMEKPIRNSIINIYNKNETSNILFVYLQVM